MWDHYGLGGEGAHIAAECERKFGYHINVENLIVEPAEPETIDTGQPTEVLVTVLDNYAWPLIRYVTGDYAVFSTRTCPCGRGVPMLERIDGRVSEVLRLPNGVKLNTHYFSVILSEAHDIAQYQVEQTARDTVLLRTVWRGRERAESITRWIVSELNKVSAGTVRVLFEDVASIPPLRSGKHRFIIALPEETRAGSN
jgi:phenylacetate-CoA ligase